MNYLPRTTGSESFKTMDDVSDSLAGRVSILDLYGFSTRELEQINEETFIPDINILRQKEIKKRSIRDVMLRIFNGSYPEINKNDGKNREQFYEDYIRTYIERDIRKVVNIKDENKFIKFISSLAVRTGQEFIASEISDDIEIDSKTVLEWLSVLGNTNLIYMLQSYSNNSLFNVIKRPKIYFMDTGLACYLAGYMSVETLEKSAFSGPIFETYVVSEIIKSFTNNGKNAKRYLYYYRDKEKREIDLLVIYDNVIYPVEIKKTSNPNNSMIKNFSVVNKFNLEIGNGILLCMVDDIIKADLNNYFIPIWYI